MEKYRCFVAFDLPGPAKEYLSEIQEKLKQWPYKVKWVEKKNFHLTLKFLGDITANQVTVLESGLREAFSRCPGGLISTAAPGAFPTVRNPKVIWMGITDPDRVLYELWSVVEKEAVRQGFPAENRSFSPHLTLGRVRERSGPGLDGLIEKIDFPEKSIPVTEIKLMKSRLSHSGPEYSCLNSFILQEHR
ncbi:MAG: RNA 2',3'-cyclic phosphodiesterase [Firmicutes bacterium HGW-Firmicutes-14]|nr:MAG: RNA 2',3'-cyclic phosphodiesterase [Firmicutes bacterium HGW-Firmicutes-14]